MNTAQAFIESAVARMLAVKAQGDGVLSQLSPPQLFHTSDSEANSVAIIVQHMHGNMLSRWTDFLTSDGDKPWRKRDQEFEPVATTPEQVHTLWQAGWKLTTDTIAALSPDDLLREVKVRAQPLTVMDAILRQLAHYSYHVGQMVTLAREQLGTEWQTLSIARGKSADYKPQQHAPGIKE